MRRARRRELLTHQHQASQRQQSETTCSFRLLGATTAATLGQQVTGIRCVSKKRTTTPTNVWPRKIKFSLAHQRVQHGTRRLRATSMLPPLPPLAERATK